MIKKIYWFLRVLALRPRSELVVVNYRFAEWCRSKGYTRLGNYFLMRSLNSYDVEICVGARLGEGVRFPHPTGIVIGGGAILGKGVIVHQGVTLGAANFCLDTMRGEDCNQVIGDRVILGAGCKILGDVTIANDCIIGANSIVTKSVTHRAIVTGINQQRLI